MKKKKEKETGRWLNLFWNRNFFICSRKSHEVNRSDSIYIFLGRENWSSFTVLNRSGDKFSTWRNKVFSTLVGYDWARGGGEIRGRNVSREGFLGARMKSVDFHERVSINIYGDIRKVKRNPIIELFRRGRLIVLVNRRVTVAICNFGF